MSDAALAYQDWTASLEVREDIATPTMVGNLAAALDRPEAPPGIGDGLPWGWHWLYFPNQDRQSAVGADGLTMDSGFMPPVPLPRRMFAGARMRFQRQVRLGDRIRRESEVISIKEKEGRSGKLAFITVGYRVFDESGLCVEEEQDIVMREAEAKTATPAAAETEPEPLADDWQQEIKPDPVMLFRFSAVTFNPHRIHYDEPYATGVEHYPGLVVHGPLTAILLLELCRDSSGGRALKSFGFRAMRPLFATAPFRVTGRPTADGRGCDLAALTPEGALAMKAEIEFADD